MSILKYANKDKTLDAGGWILDYDFLWEIKYRLDKLQDEYMDTSPETIEATLLIFNGEEELLKQRLIELEDENF